MIESRRIVTVVFTVADLDRSMQLYSEAFGLVFRLSDHDGDNPWASGRHAAISWTGSELMDFALYASKDGTTTSGAQIAFRVEDTESAHTTAVAAGAEVLHDPIAQPWGRSSRYKDLDGNVIELTQPG